MDRFCVGGPDIGGSARRSNGADARPLTFAELASRLEASMCQASLLLNDRLSSLQNRLRAGSCLTAPQEHELCAIADGIMAASYHVQKWAHALQGKDGQHRKPTRPGPSETAAEAVALVHLALPRLSFSVSEVDRGLGAAIKAHGDDAEAKVRRLGVPSEDIRAIAPHMELYVMRLGRLSSDVKPPPLLRQFIPEYFKPVLGKRLAMRLLPYLF